MYEMRWKGLKRLSWECEADLQHFCPAILRYENGRLVQRGVGYLQYQNMRLYAAAREFHRLRGERYIRPGYELVSLRCYQCDFAQSPRNLKGASLWFKDRDSHWWLELIRIVGSQSTPYTVRFVDRSVRAELRLPDHSYSTDLAAPLLSWCLQHHRRGARHNTHDIRQDADLDDDANFGD